VGNQSHLDKAAGACASLAIKGQKQKFHHALAMIWKRFVISDLSTVICHLGAHCAQINNK